MGNVEALEGLGRPGQPEGLAQEAKGGRRRLHGGRVDPLEMPGFFQGLLQGEDDIPKGGGLLELLAERGRLHLLAEGFEPLAGLALEEEAGVLDPFPVEFGGDGGLQAVDFLAEVVVELPGAVRQLLRRAVAQKDPELAAQLRQGLAKEPAVRKRPEIPGLVVLFEPGEPETREGLG